MKAAESCSNTSVAIRRKIHRSERYRKVLDGRKHPIRGLWERNGRFIARITVEDASGSKHTKWVPLGDDDNPVTTVPQAVAAHRTLLTRRADDDLPVLQRTPKFADYVQTYMARVKDRKRPATLLKERGALSRWSAHLGGSRLDKINRAQVNDYIVRRKRAKMSGRTVNLDVIALRNLIRMAIDDNWLRRSPLDNLRAERVTTKARPKVTFAEIENLCAAAFAQRNDGTPVTKNAQQFTDYIRLMSFCGSRRDETLRMRWPDVDFDRRQLTVGADGLSKNHKPRVVDFNPELETHLADMQKRRQPDSDWLFPSPQRGEKDLPAKTFKDSLEQARSASQLPGFNFHDCRHYFISQCVMSGIDFMTIARWVGHQDGGVLIGKVYGDVANEHRQRMAQKIVFRPSIVTAEAVNS